MTGLLLDAAYLMFLLAVSPWLIYRRVAQKRPVVGLGVKLTGRLERRHPDRPCVWFHAVSVGEVLQLKTLLERMKAGYPQHEFVITTTTGTGYDVAKQKYPDYTVQFFPFDFSWAVREAMLSLDPELIVLVELELWPNFLRIAEQLEIPVVIINGRISDQSFKSYRKVTWLTRRLLEKCTLIAAQNVQYAERFLDLGAAPSRLFQTGNIKFDGVETNRANAGTEELRRHFGLRPGELVFLAGSTQESEEAFALSTWETLRPEFPNLRLLIVPRHKERFEEVAELIVARGHQLIRRSLKAEGGRRKNGSDAPQPILLLDTLGELSKAWGLADVAFVGGSLTDRGGQNMIEPAGYGAAVLFGPNTWNFRDVTEALLSRGAAIVVRDAEEMTSTIRRLVADESARKRLGDAARRFVASQQGATERTMALLGRLISSREITAAKAQRAA